MKRFSLAMTWLAVAGLMTTVSCRKPVMGFTNGEARTVTVSAVTESGGGSKTAIEGLNVKWSENDQISMNGCVLELKEGAGTTEGVFEGTVTSEAPYYVGYPANKTTYDNGTLKLNIPAEWTYNTEKQIVPMAAVTNSVEGGLQFHNAVNMLKLQLTGGGDDANASKLTSIVLTSTTSNLSGDINVTFNGGVPEFAAIADADRAGKTTMTVSFGDGLQLGETVQCVYIPLAKIAAGGDLIVHFSCANGMYMEKKVTADANFNGVNNMLSAELPVNATEHEYVDFGLSVKWATCNLGASKPEEYGDYYAWGETETKSTYDLSTYKWCDGTEDTFTKYCTDSRYGKVDNKTVLDLEDDAARANWGGAWRMPTIAEWEELRYNTYMEWVYGYAGGVVNGFIVYKAKDEADRGLMRLDLNYNPGAPGWKIYDKDWNEASLEGDYSLLDAHLFLPAAGYRDGTDLFEAGSAGNSWSSSLCEYPDAACSMFLHSGNANPQNYNSRFMGLSVRPVR